MADGLPVGRVRRLLAPGALGAKTLAGHAASWVGSLGRPDEEKQRRLLDRTVRSAEDAVALMGEMKGAVMKLGQVMSFADVSMLPPEFQTVMAQLQADAPPMAWELVEGVVREELGADPDELFERFSRVPIAAASIGQVHAARLHDDTDVVVKVQYPSVAEAIEADLQNAALLSTIATSVQAVARPLMPRSDVKALVAEVRDRVIEELDYTQEAANQQEFADLWRDDAVIRVPRVHPAFSTRRVLTQDYHDGMRWPAAVEASQELRDAWGAAIYRFVFTNLYRHRVFNADPHPGNYLFHEDGGVSFLDFGCVRRFTEEQVAELRGFGKAILAQDADALVAQLVDAGVLRRASDVDAERQLGFSSFEWAPVLADGPFTYSKEWAEEAVRHVLGMTSDYFSLVTKVSVPPHWLFLGRITLGVASILTGLNATANWRAILEEIWAG